MSDDGWEQRLDDVGQARELRETVVDTLVASVGAQMPRGKAWRPDPIADALLSGPLAPLLAAQAAVERVEALAKSWERGPTNITAAQIRAAIDGPVT